MLRGTIAGLCLLSTTLLPGCSYLESLSGLFSNVKFSAKPVRAIAPPYDFRIGDVYRYRVGDLFSEEDPRLNGNDRTALPDYGRQVRRVPVFQNWRRGTRHAARAFIINDVKIVQSDGYARWKIKRLRHPVCGVRITHAHTRGMETH